MATIIKTETKLIFCERCACERMFLWRGELPRHNGTVTVWWKCPHCGWLVCEE